MFRLKRVVTSAWLAAWGALAASAALPALASPDAPKEIKVHGYVTSVTSPTEFEIEDYKISRDRQLAFTLDNAEGAGFRPEDVRVGTELEIKGTYDESTGRLHATSIKVDMAQFKKRRQTAVIAYQPVGVARTDAGWSGRFVADGERITVTPETKVLFELSPLEKKLAKAAHGDVEVRPLRSLDEVQAGMLMSYEGSRQPDGSILCESVTFAHNDLEDGEAKLWKELTPEIKEFTGEKPSELKIKSIGKFKIVHDERAQSYVIRIGDSLVPPYDRDRPVADPRKLHWRFFVVQEKQPNAFALANGTVVVNSGLFSVLENEAQLAAVMGHEIAHATQEHTWRELQFHKKERIGLAIGAMVAAGFGKYALADALSLTAAAIISGYSRYVENQADRVGLEYMVSAGYDPREAPRLWKAMAKKVGDAPAGFWGNHDNASTRRSYLMNAIRNNYSDLNFDQTKTNSDEFATVKSALVPVHR